MHGEGETADMGYNIVMSGTDKYAGHPWTTSLQNINITYAFARIKVIYYTMMLMLMSDANELERGRTLGQLLM